VKAFEPYDKLKEENLEARAAGKALIVEGKAAGPKRKSFVFVNNRLGGKRDFYDCRDDVGRDLKRGCLFSPAYFELAMYCPIGLR
jgi:hypothetical protein